MSKSKKSKSASKSEPKPKPKEKKAAKANAKEKKLSCLDAAVEVLKAEGKPLNCKAMVDGMFSRKLWHTDAPTPAATLYSAILREIGSKKSEARFRKVDRGQFALTGAT
jgi:hypothetical protein